MFITNVHGKEKIEALANKIGCKSGEALKGICGYGRPGLVGNTFPIKDQLKNAGFKFDAENKAWTADSWADVERVLQQLV